MKSITLTATDEEYAAAMPGFLRVCPIPTKRDGTPQMTQGAWLKQWLMDKFDKARKRGEQKLASDSVVTPKTFK